MKPLFVFERYEVSADNELSFYYSYRDDNKTIGQFQETYKLPIRIDAAEPVTAYILQQLHIAVGTSYYKSLLGVIQLPYELSDTEADYWNTVYDNGLGEYAYLNKITEPIKPFAASKTADRQPIALEHTGALLGIGGGKDSIVAGELCKRLQLETTTMDMATRDHHGQAGAVMDSMGLPQLRVERYLDTGIVDFTNQHNGNNGHIPLSAILAWLGILLAHASGKQYILMANEAGTSVGNVTWQGREVNHQWSKSFAFEKLTQDFLHRQISPDMSYFSPIRAYSSLAVMELLAKLGKDYYQAFTSCNLVLRIDPAARPNGRWCTRCAKCVSSWLLLAPWLSTDQLVTIFGRDIFQDASLQTMAHELLGLSGHKPLDCVGTIEELRAVSRHIITRSPGLPLLANITLQDIPGPTIEDLIHSTGPTNIPAELQPKIAATVTRLLGLGLGHSLGRTNDVFK